MRIREVEYYVGLDLGKKQSFTAIVVLERSVEKEEVRDPVYWTQDWVEGEPRYAVRHVERIPLETSYVEVVDRVRGMLVRAPLSGSGQGRARLLVDATGAGAPVVDLFREWDVIRPVLTPVTITAGNDGSAGSGEGEWRVPRKDLVAGTVVLFEGRTLTIAAGLPGARALVEELVHFGRSVGGVGVEQQQPTDLVMALSLAVWGATSHRKALMRGAPKKKTAKERAAEMQFVEMLYGVSGPRRS